MRYAITAALAVVAICAAGVWWVENNVIDAFRASYDQ